MNNLDLLNKRLKYQGGTQQGRMIADKYKTFQKALYSSYQGADIKKINDANIYRGLINPNKLKPDYDDKILSIDYDSKFKPGDIFEWVGTDTYWIIYLQKLTEKAYFMGDIRKCSFNIKWKDKGVEKSTYAAIRGPVETQITNISKHDINIDTPNLSLHLLMPKNEDTLKQFQRYSKFYLQTEKNIEPICWRVETIDYISMPGVLEVVAEEYYSNEIEDDINEGIVGGLIPSVEDPNKDDVNEIILGETFIKTRKTYKYHFNKSNDNDSWSIPENLPIQIIAQDKYNIELRWTANYSGEFKLSYGPYSKILIVDSLF